MYHWLQSFVGIVSCILFVFKLFMIYYAKLNYFWYFICVLLSVFMGLILFWVLMYVFRRERPIIITRMDKNPHKYIMPYITKSKYFNPFFMLFNRDLETVFSDNLAYKLNFELKKEIIKVKKPNSFHYSGHVSIEWTPFHQKYTKNPYISPIILICPGLTGDSRRPYVKKVLEMVNNIGWQGCVFNPRGRGGLTIKTPQAYSVGYTYDLRQVIQYIYNKYNGKRPIFGIGFSLGSNYLAKYVGEEKDKCLLKGIVCCACPTDLILCRYHVMQRPFFDRYLAQILQRTILKKKEYISLFENRLNVNKAKKAEYLREFDHYFIAPQFGFKSCNDYYRKSGCGNVLPDIKIPTLFIMSKNDTLIPYQVVSLNDYDTNPNISCILTRYGSHGMWWIDNKNIFKYLFTRNTKYLNSWGINVSIQYFKGILSLYLCKKCQSITNKIDMSKEHENSDDTDDDDDDY